VKVLGAVVTPADRGALAQLCTAWARYCYAEKMIMESAGNEGLVVQSKESRPMLGPWLAISNRAIEIHSKLCAEFGLTPSSRTRIHTGVPQRPPEPPEGPKKKAGWEQFR
jgi:P27 family predicted phage terminase small subunit